MATGFCALGRFSATDAVQGDSSNTQSLNRYAYVADDPIDATDPTGDDSISDRNPADPSIPGPNYSLNPDLAAITGSKGYGAPIDLRLPGAAGGNPSPPPICGEGGNCGYPIVIVPPPPPFPCPNPRLQSAFASAARLSQIKKGSADICVIAAWELNGPLSIHLTKDTYSAGWSLSRVARRPQKTVKSVHRRSIRSKLTLRERRLMP